MTSPLSNVKVLELAVAIAGPSCAGILADWGASVTKIEPYGDRSRMQYFQLNGVDKNKPEQVSPLFFLDSRGKQSITLDLKNPVEREILEKMFQDTDVFVSNLREEALKRLHLGSNELLKKYPALVIGRITGYGRYGPDKDLPAYEPTAAWARAGLAESFRSYDNKLPPMLAGGFVDHATGLAVAGGISAALFQKKQTGKGCVVDGSLMRSGLYLNSWANSYALTLNGNHSKHADVRNMTPYSATQPYWGQGPLSGFYRTKDKKLIYIKADTRQKFSNLCKVIGRPDLITDNRFNKTALRRTNINGKLLYKHFEEAIAKMNMRNLEKGCLEEDIVFAIAQTPEDVMKYDVQAKPAIVKIPKSQWHDEVETIATPVDFSSHTNGKQIVIKPKGKVPNLGEDTEEILRNANVSEDVIQLVLKKMLKSSKL